MIKVLPVDDNPLLRSPKSRIARSQFQVFRSFCESPTLKTGYLCNGFFQASLTVFRALDFFSCGSLRALC